MWNALSWLYVGLNWLKVIMIHIYTQFGSVFIHIFVLVHKYLGLLFFKWYIEMNSKFLENPFHSFILHKIAKTANLTRYFYCYLSYQLMDSTAVVAHVLCPFFSAFVLIISRFRWTNSLLNGNKTNCKDII